MIRNAIFESSSRRRMRTAITPVVVTAYVAALCALGLLQLTLFFGEGMTIASMRRGVECYIWQTAAQFFLILMVAPALSAGSIAGERERQTFDLLVVTGIGARRIVMGKLMESFAFLALLIMSSLPAMSLVLLTGGVSAADILATLLYLMLVALGSLAVGTVTSVLFKRTLTAVIAAYLCIFLIGSGTWGLAKHGPLAATYSYTSLQMLSGRPSLEIILGMPSTIFLNAAVGLVTLLASQTGILHTTMQETMRLYDIYSAAKAAGFGAVSLACLLALAAAVGLTIVAACALLHLQIGGKKKR